MSTDFLNWQAHLSWSQAVLLLLFGMIAFVALAFAIIDYFERRPRHARRRWF